MLLREWFQAGRSAFPELPAGRGVVSRAVPVRSAKSRRSMSPGTVGAIGSMCSPCREVRPIQAEFRLRIGGNNGVGVKRNANLRHRVVRSNRFLPEVDGHFRKIATLRRPAESGDQLVPNMPDDQSGRLRCDDVHNSLSHAAARAYGKICAAASTAAALITESSHPGSADDVSDGAVTRIRSATFLTEAATRSPLSVLIGLSEISAGNFEPFFRRP